MPKRIAELQHLMRRAEAGCTWCIVDGVPGEVILIAKSDNSCVPDAFHLVPKHPRRYPFCGTIEEIVQVQSDFVLLPPQAICHKLTIRHSVIALEIRSFEHILCETPRIGFEKALATQDLTGCCALGRRAPEPRGVELDDFCEAQAARFGCVCCLKHLLQVHKHSRVLQ